MKTGFYVRCPLYIEEADEEYPRCFILARIIGHNEMADAYIVEPCDLLGTKGYYLAERSGFVFSSEKIERCAGAIGGIIQCAMGRGHIVAHDEPADQDTPYQYYIKLDSGKYVVIDELHLHIEYTQMDYSPIKQLLKYEFQNPSWYASRINVSRNVNFMDNASYGFKTMAGCRAFMLPHQVSTIARCFEFTPIRYMLADEVGLGKTIEACSIVKIMQSDNNKLKSLFVVPGSLLNQWRNELQYKFSFAKELAEGSCRLVAQEDFLRVAGSIGKKHWDILIVDETHRLLKNDALYDAILAQSKITENLLLLSATPIQDRKEEYHKLLSLLAPNQYLEMTEDRFSKLVDKQKKIQRSVNIILRRMDSFEDYKEDILERIANIGESLMDERLNKMIDSMNKLEEPLAKVQDILSYICENYRMERRVVRNRRAAITTAMPKRVLEEISYIPGTSDSFYDETTVINTVMEFLSESSDESDEFVRDVAQPLLSAAFSSPWALKALLISLRINDDGLVKTVDNWCLQAEQELSNANYFLDEDPDRMNSRILRVVDYIEQQTDVLFEPVKVVIFTAFTETLEKLHELLDTRLKENSLFSVCFSKNMSRDDLETSVFEFQNNESCRVIICDETGGEGRNFQNAEMIIHVDLPWTANSLEQRIGRLDRLGRSPDSPVKSVVIYAENTTDEQLFKIWRDGMHLFTESLSGMEIITAELNEMIVDAMTEDYYNGLANAIPEIVDAMDDLRDAVQDEQEYDVGSAIYRPLYRAIDDMLSTYLDGEGSAFAQSMLSWGNQAGLVPDRQRNDGLLQFSTRGFSPRAALQSLFTPPDWAKYEGTSIVRRENQILGTFSRSTAISREDLLFFAPNDPLYESISSNAMGCSRGRCCAVAIKDGYDYSGFVFTFLARPNLKVLFEKNISPRILSQFRIFLPQTPITVFVPLTEASTKVPENTLMELLDASWKIRNGEHLGRRGNSKYSPLEKFMCVFPEDTWNNMVKYGVRQAYKLAEVKFQEEADLNMAKREISRLIAGRRAEYTYFDKNEEEIAEEIKMYKIAWEALKTSSLVIDSVCYLRVVK